MMWARFQQTEMLEQGVLFPSFHEQKYGGMKMQDKCHKTCLGRLDKEDRL